MLLGYKTGFVRPGHNLASYSNSLFLVSLQDPYFTLLAKVSQLYAGKSGWVYTKKMQQDHVAMSTTRTYQVAG